MDANWRTAFVAECLAPLSLAGRTKVQARDYQAAGRFPVVDQGHLEIAGWTDDERAVIDEPLPLILFGDHTRALKFVDFPFARGADGTQILNPKDDIDPLYFYYACRAVQLPARGYNRHFGVLKEQIIPLPPGPDQASIGNVLRGVERVLSSEARLIQAAQHLKHSVMRELFTRGLRGEPQKETEIGSIPESWTLQHLGALGRVGNGSTPKKTATQYWAGGTYPWLTSAKVYDRDIFFANHFVTQEALTECHLPRLQPGAVLVAITGQGKTLGHCAVLRIEATISQHLAYIAVDLSLALASFVRSYLETRYDYLRNIAAGGGSTKGALTCAFLRGLVLPLPSLSEQEAIVEVLESIDRKIDLHKRKKRVLEELFTALLNGLMTGETRVADLNLSVLQPTGKRVAATV